MGNKMYAYRGYRWIFTDDLEVFICPRSKKEFQRLDHHAFYKFDFVTKEGSLVGRNVVFKK